VITLKLDGTDVTGPASKLQTMTNPASLGLILYTPLSDLPDASHTATLMYPAGAGTATFTWTFTTSTAITCPPPSGSH
jgi:hypothetical protein